MTAPALVAVGAPVSGSDHATGAFGQSTTAGNLLLAFAWSNNPGSSYPFSAPSGWSLAVSGGVGYNWLGLYYKANCGSGETAPQFTDTGYLVYSGLAEFSGAATSSPLDQTGNANGALCQASAVDSTGGDLVIGGASWNGSNANDDVSFDLYGSDGSSSATTGPVGLSGNNWTNSGSNTGSPVYLFMYGTAAATLGSHADKIDNVASIEYENYPTYVIASFKAA